MTGRMSLLAFVAASGAVHGLPQMPDRPMLLGLCITAVLCTAITAWRLPRQRRWHVLAPLWMAMAGFLLTVARVEYRLADRLDTDNENKVARVVLRIAGLPKLGPDSRQFEAEVISSIPEGVPSRIQVSWAAEQWAGPYGRADRTPASFPELIPGQVWRMALTLKPPHGTRNPQAFDYESYAFAHGIRALGSVRGKPKYLYDEPWASLPVVAQRARHAVRAAMRPYLHDKRYGAVLLALAIGDQASVEASDWLVFNRSGITHLVSISGSHITMIAAMGGLLTLFLWRRMRWRGQAWAERLPAQVAAALAALLVAWLYCLLAGWGVPARRTFFMLAVIFFMYILRITTTPFRVLSLVAFVVVLLDPWALLASGFWLSFGAVYVLMASSGWYGQAMGQTQLKWRQRMPEFLATATRLQLAITVGLMPLLALIFHEVSIVSPLVNAYAIPVISLLVTPLALLLAGSAMAPGLEFLALACAWLGHAALDAIMLPTVWLSGLRAASFHVAAAPLWLTVIAILGLAAATLPYGIPGRHLAWLLVAPALLWWPNRPPEGSWDLHALDIGQGSAVLIQTARHAVLFDAGLRSSATSDVGARIIWPFLRSQGVNRLGALIVSHADIDHAGGVRSILEALPVAQSYSSFNLLSYLKREARLLGMPDQLPPLPPAMSLCAYGINWHVDGVTFEFLWPLAAAGAQAAESTKTKARNAQACVLRVRGRHHTALLTADIGSRQEADLVARGLGSADVVMVAHHGSKTSSSPEFVAETQAAHVVAQAGAWNRYGHPAASIQARWQDSGAQFWRTDHHGAISLQSRPEGLQARSERMAARRYWQHAMQD
ncbi:ComEC/Rec2 [Pusillimonas sp. T7-7]|uniref:DNA internalization-related competence protein ComEC/Rec2 n=1 Tax=Pusillimonas sp. (strain T7-7) TaxID=1007105 RepID=UPI0002084B0F|nr:DNA internalization-related competence protein ComEC/Rec2 [Pusillimonas sp. T7-7]AEC19375.1 ComEC/Rec2 [Pusillimonas sp. T7-7]